MRGIADFRIKRSEKAGKGSKRLIFIVKPAFHAEKNAVQVCGNSGTENRLAAGLTYCQKMNVNWGKEKL